MICYNHRKYIAQCLDSVLAQSGDFTMEIVVADDFSTDGTREIVEEYGRRDPRFRILESDRNLGMGANVRRALEACTGEFIAPCEGDDFWTDPLKLSKQLSVAAEDPQLTLCVTGGVKVDESAKAQLGLIAMGGPSRQLTLAELISARDRISTASMLMRRTAVINLPPETYDQPVIDYPLQVLVGAQGTISYLASLTCAYRMNAIGSWSQSMATSDEKFVLNHAATRGLQQFIERQLGAKWTPDVRSAFEPITLGFYMSSRSSAADKLSNLPLDLPRLSSRGRTLATLLTRAPGLVAAAAFARRRLWAPVARRLRGNSKLPKLAPGEGQGS